MASPMMPSGLRALRHTSRYQSSIRNSRSWTLARRSFTTTECRAADAKQQSAAPPPPINPYAKQQAPSGPSGFTNIAEQLRKSSVLRGTTEPYIAYGGTEDLFQECSRQCNYTIPALLQKPPGEPPLNKDGEEVGVGTGWWFEPKSKGGLELPVTFNTWAQVMFLHMWLLTVRFRCFPKEYVKNWDQHLLDHFFYAAEDRMATWHRMSSRGVRNKYLKDLWTQWRGVLLSYDEGLIKGDAALATAVWRNIFRADENVDIRDLEIIVEYMMKELNGLGKVGDEVVTEGRVRFSNIKRS